MMRHSLLITSLSLGKSARDAASGVLALFQAMRVLVVVIFVANHSHNTFCCLEGKVGFPGGHLNTFALSNNYKH